MVNAATASSLTRLFPRFFEEPRGRLIAADSQPLELNQFDPATWHGLAIELDQFGIETADDLALVAARWLATRTTRGVAAEALLEPVLFGRLLVANFVVCHSGQVAR